MDDDVLFIFSAYCCFFSEHIPLERLNIGFGAFVFAYYFFMHFLPYMKEKRGEEEDPIVEEAREQEHKRIERRYKETWKTKMVFESKNHIRSLLYYAANWLFVCILPS